MLGKVKNLDARLLTRRCVGCGYDGAALRRAQARRCIRCGCDLIKRPPRSYAEMEGLLGHPLTIDAPLTTAHQEIRIIHRWFLVLALWAVLMIAIACLSTVALTAV